MHRSNPSSPGLLVVRPSPGGHSWTSPIGHQKRHLGHRLHPQPGHRSGGLYLCISSRELGLPSLPALVVAPPRRAPVTCVSLGVQNSDLLSSDMSRGTRRGDDVYCVGNWPDPEEEDDRRYVHLPNKFSFPESFSSGSGRILRLNNRLLKFYGDIGYYHNEHFLMKLSNDNDVTNASLSREYCRSIVTEILVELQALGSEIYLPEELVDAGYVQRPPQIAPFGSMEYLCSPPHYFSPEEYDVPHSLPATDKLLYTADKRATLEGSNCYLAMKYGVLARHLNKIKLYRDNRIRLKLDVSRVLPGNNLKDEILNCRGLLDSVVKELRKNIDRGHADRLFFMPCLLRDKIFEENSIVNVRPLDDISCLYPDSQIPDRSRRYTYLLYESVMGYSLFRFYGVAGDLEPILPALLGADRVKSYINLVDHYPFTSDSAKLQHCKYISKGILSDELRLFLQLNLPAPKMWNWSYSLGVCDQNLADEIHKETQIPCVSGQRVVELFRVVHQHLHAFLQIESSEIDKELLRIGRLELNIEKHIENMVIQASHSLDISDRNIRLLSLNLRKLYSPHFPELDGIVKDNFLYAKIVKCIGNKSQLSQGDLTTLNDVIARQDLVKLITDSAKSSIGQGITPLDLDIVNLSVNNIVRLVESHDKLLVNLAEYMKAFAPNLRALIGERDGARLIACAGSLKDLIGRRSTIHLLGADCSTSSDGGVLWNSEHVLRATTIEGKRKLASYLGSKCYSAAREDYLGDANTSDVGKKLCLETRGELHLIEKEREEMRKLPFFERWARCIKLARERGVERTYSEDGSEDSTDSSSFE